MRAFAVSRGRVERALGAVALLLRQLPLLLGDVALLDRDLRLPAGEAREEKQQRHRAPG